MVFWVVYLLLLCGSLHMLHSGAKQKKMVGLVEKVWLRSV